MSLEGEQSEGSGTPPSKSREEEELVKDKSPNGRYCHVSERERAWVFVFLL